MTEDNQTDAQPDIAPEPSGAVALLEAQLAEALGILKFLNQAVCNSDLDMTDRRHTAGTAGELMSKSAILARVIAELQGDGPDETRHRMIIEHAPQPRGEGGRPPQKRIRRGKS